MREVKSDPAGAPPRKLLIIEYVHSLGAGCVGPRLVDTTQAVEFRWRPPPWEVGSDGVRQILNEPVTGPGRYRLSGGSAVVIRIPAGVTIEVEGAGYAGGIYHLLIRDLASGAELFIDNDTGEDIGRQIPDGVDASKANALFDQIIASVETPGWGGN